MATYNSLSEMDRSIVQNTVNLIRSSIGEKAKAWNRVKGIADDTNAVNLIVNLDAAEIVPNTSGLSGADDLTREEIIDLYTILDTDRTTNDNPTNRALMSKGAGINAILG